MFDIKPVVIKELNCVIDVIERITFVVWAVISWVWVRFRVPKD